jgi:tetratricopeptide (TPR) repeat protein
VDNSLPLALTAILPASIMAFMRFAEWLTCLALTFFAAADSLETVFQQAASALTSGNYADAEHGFTRVLQKEPNHVGALGNLGVVYSRTQRPAKAIETYRKALRLSPRDPALLLNLGLVYLKQESYRQAAGSFSRILTLKPAHAQARELLATCRLHLGETAAAIESLEALRKTNPMNAGVLYLLGIAYLKEKQRDKATRVLDEMMLSALSPAQAHFLLGKAYYDGAHFLKPWRLFKRFCSWSLASRVSILKSERHTSV